MPRTLQDLIIEELCKGGVKEATSVSVTMKNGETIVIHSDNHPALTRSADDVASVAPRQSAQGGL